MTGPWQFTLACSATQRATSFELGVAGAYLYEETVDVGGDGPDGIVVAAINPGIWMDWWVWDSADHSLHKVEMGLCGPGAEHCPAEWRDYLCETPSSPLSDDAQPTFLCGPAQPRIERRDAGSGAQRHAHDAAVG